MVPFFICTTSEQANGFETPDGFVGKKVCEISKAEPEKSLNIQTASATRSSRIQKKEIA